MDFQPENQEYDTDSLRTKEISPKVQVTKETSPKVQLTKEISPKSENRNLIKDLVLGKNSEKIIDLVSQILNSVDVSETIKEMEKIVTEKDEILWKDQVDINDQKNKAKECKKIAKKSVTEFRKVTKMLSEMRKNNGQLDKKLSLNKICQLLEEMSLHDYETTEFLSNISALRELALETDIVIKKLAKLRKKGNMSEGDVVAKMTIMSLYEYEKIFRFLRIFIKRFFKEVKNGI